jgi:serine O-acetyltransferase
VGLRAAFRADLDRYFFRARQLGAVGTLEPLRMGITEPGLWAATTYRLNHYVRSRTRMRLLGALTRTIHFIVQALTGIHIHPEAHIGSGLKFPHGGHIVIGPMRIGSNCDIYQGVTLGKGNSVLHEHPDTPDVPTLGNRVWVGPGAVVAGSLTVGNDAVVAANSLVVHDVPPLGVVIGVPARLASRHGSLTQIKYRGMDDDDERKVASAAASEARSGPMQKPRSGSALPASP